LRPRLRFLPAIAIVTAFVSAPSSVAAQAFTAPEGVGTVTMAWQFVDNTGHRGTDGFFVARGQSVTTSVLAEVEYGITDRLAATVGLPYVFAKYSGALPPPSQLPVDACKCWHSSFQDLSLAARYRLGSDAWAITPVVSYGRPSHDYPYRGEAVVGNNLQELRVGVFAGLRLVDVLPKASLQGGYTYAFVEKAIDEIKVDRSNGFVDFGYALMHNLYVRGTAAFLRTHGGLHAGSASGHPFPLPGEFNTPERRAESNRLLSTRRWDLGAGVSYSLGPVDVFVSYTKYVWGRDAHNGQVYTAGTSWYFDLSH
jgi:hypothetical protein